MGCCVEARQSTLLVDLPRRPAKTGCKIEAWEVEMPFGCCSMTAYAHALNQAHFACGKKGFVTLDRLGFEFHTLAWNPIRNQESELCAFLKEHLAHPTEKDAISYDQMMMLGILYCQDQDLPRAKAIQFYNLLQEGGVEK